jgi:hypothetical protein
MGLDFVSVAESGPGFIADGRIWIVYFGFSFVPNFYSCTPTYQNNRIILL